MKRTLKRTLIPFAAFGLFVVGCGEPVATTPAADDLAVSPQFNAAGPIVHRASLGGADICVAFGLSPGCDANHSLIAIEDARGNVKGQWHDQFAGGVGVHVAVSCLSVSGNDAWVSGTVKTSRIPGIIGLPLIIRLQDNGQSGDQVSFTTLAANANACVNQPALGLFAITGQVKVQ